MPCQAGSQGFALGEKLQWFPALGPIFQRHQSPFVEMKKSFKASSSSFGTLGEVWSCLCKVKDKYKINDCVKMLNVNRGYLSNWANARMHSEPKASSGMRLNNERCIITQYNAQTWQATTVELVMRTGLNAVGITCFCRPQKCVLCMINVDISVYILHTGYICNGISSIPHHLN